MTDVLNEVLLSRALKAVAEAAIPDSSVPAVSEVAGWGAYDEDFDWEDAEADWVGSPHRHRLGRGLGALAAVLALGGAGAGIAAAAGAFSTEGVRLIAPAVGWILPTGRWTAANVTTRISEPGPDGSTLTLQTASADSAGGCIRLGISTPGAAPSEDPVSCDASFNTVHPPTTHTPTSTAYGTATKFWTSPVGKRWLFVYGRSQTPSAVEVAAVSTSGTALATAPILNGWFILSFETTEGTTQQRADRHLVYYGSTGHQTGAYPSL